MAISKEKVLGIYDITKNFVEDDKSVGQENINRKNKDDSGAPESDVRKHIDVSWERCIKSGLSPHEPPRLQKVSDHRLNILRERYNDLLSIVDEYAAKIKLIVSEDSCVIALGDRSGVLFYVNGDNPELKSIGYEPGYIHNEFNMGNNALGSCIYANEPTAIFGSEHFLKVLSKWADFAAPIRNMDNELEAVIALIMPAELANKYIFGVIMMAAQGIEKELRLMNEKSELMANNEVLSDFSQGIINTASMLSHEVKNSLSNISAYIQLLQLEKVLDNSRAGRLLGEVSRINKILDDFKRLTKPIHMNFSIYSLNDILLPTIEIMKPKASIHGIQLNISIPQESIYAKADKNLLQQVFVNIIENAIQAMGNGGLLDVKLEYDEKGEDILIVFTDTGPGIPKERINEIFKLFYTTKKTGSGLGLSLCQSIIKWHGGQIKVDSAVGQGSTFTIILPAHVIK